MLLHEQSSAPVPTGRAHLLDALRYDLRYALRALFRAPGFTFVAVLTLALGIGTNTAIFSALDAVLLRPLPFAQPDRLVTLDRLEIPFRSTDGVEAPSTEPQIDDARRLREISHLAVYAAGGLNLSGSGAPRRVRIAAVTPEFFTTLGVHPRGRGFTAEEGQPGGSRVAVVSDAFWRRHLASSTNLAGTTDLPGMTDFTGATIRLNGRSHVVVGVMPRGFAFPQESEIWIPMTVPRTAESYEPFRQFIPSNVVARLAPGVTLAQGRQAMVALFDTFGMSAEDMGMNPADFVRPFQASLASPRRSVLLLLLGATSLVMLIACANIANLLLSRGAARRRETAVRTALGATPARVVRQLFTENIVLALIGGALGLALATFSLKVLDALVPSALAGTAPLHIDARVLIFAVLLTVASGLLFGLLPALGARRMQPGDVLKHGGYGAVAAGHSTRARQAFVVAELAFAVMLLIGSALMLRSLYAVLTNEPGIEADRVATLELTLAAADYPTIEDHRRFYERVLGRLASLPQVAAAAAINELPLRGAPNVRFPIHPEGRRPDSFSARNMTQGLRITPDYFDAMGIRVLLGRAPRPAADSGYVQEVAVSQAFAQLWWPGQSPIGERIAAFDDTHYEIVGVVANVRPTTLESDIIPQAYFALLDESYDNAAIVVRGRAAESELTRMLAQTVQDVAPAQAVYNVRAMEDVVQDATATRRTSTTLLTAFGLLALALAAIGVYGVISFSVAHRTREIGIRRALGASPAGVRWMILREAGLLACVGAAIGIAGAWALARVVRGMVYGVTATDATSFVLAPLVLLVVAAAAALIPAQRATRVDPARVILVE